MIRWTVYILLAALAVLAAWFSFGDRFDDPNQPMPEDIPALLGEPLEEPAPEQTDAVPARAAGTAAPGRSEPLPRQVRPIGPDRFAAPPVPLEQLERVEPREPLGDLALAPDPATMAARKTLLFRPVAAAAGLIEAQGHVIRLTGVEPLDPEATCEWQGRQWPCGRHARGAFRAWLRGRALDCEVRPIPLDEPVVSACSLAGQDAAEWLAAHGWVLEAEPPYEEALEAARKEGRGIFGPPPS